MGTNACDDVFGWADRDPGRAMFAVQADGDYVLAKYASDIDALYARPGHAVPPDGR